MNMNPGDLSTCDKEPIHIPGSIQPHGLLLTLHPDDFTLQQYSENWAEIKVPHPKPGQRLQEVLGNDASEILEKIKTAEISSNPFYIKTLTLQKNSKSQSYFVLAHRHQGVLFLEFEATSEEGPIAFAYLYPLVHSFISSLQDAETIEQLSHIAAREVQRITGFDRALIYKFDPDWNGEVIAEHRLDDAFPSLMGHHFPASDIPRQARELYLWNRMRLIPDANYKPVAITPPLNPLTKRPLDLSHATLRSVSPVHVEYMKNMQTLSSMSVSILVEGKLWGLISCHHRTPLLVPFDVRTACDFIGQFLSLHIAATEHGFDYERRIELKAINSRLLAMMTASEHFSEALIKNKSDVMDLTGAQGVAVILEEQCLLLGNTPDEKQVRDLANWLAREVRQEIYHTVSLSNDFKPAEAYKDSACGVLAISISKLHQSFIIWFRPEVLQTIKWGGDPRKPAGHEPNVRIDPRKSFETWKEIVDLKSLPWQQSEIDAAAELRNSVMGIVLKRAEEMADLTEELERSNRELEAFSHSVSHDLRAPFRHIVGYSELLKEMEYSNLSERGKRYVDNILESGQFAGELVDNLLNFSQVGRLPLDPVPVDMDRLTHITVGDVMQEASGRNIKWEISPLPTVCGDLLLLRLVLRNLLGNAVKYTRKRPEAIIQVGVEISDDQYQFHVRDNGVGFEMQYVDKLFGVFQRLHKMEDFEGTGIGLANVKRIINRHGGHVWAEGKVDHGATFYFTLPMPDEEGKC
jgi:two-component system, chemotaxis family, sensor kinase Cph1